MNPRIQHIFLSICGITVVGGLGLLGWKALGAEDSTSALSRLKQMIKGETTQLIATAPVCLPDVGALTLGADISADDPRLVGDNLIVVRKADRRLQRFSAGQALLLEDGGSACWTVGLGPSPEGHKYKQGDGRTPEGWYRTSDKPWSQWYAAIAIHYPNAQDAQAGRLAKRIGTDTEKRITSALKKDKKPLQNTALGGEILIHGQGATDWTLGCIGMDNADIDALRLTLPSDMTTNVLVLP